MAIIIGDMAIPEKVIDKIKGQIPVRRLGRPGWAKPGHVPSARDSRIRRLGAEVFAKIDFR